LALRFEWDPQKAAANLAKHAVAFEEAATFSAILPGGLQPIRDIRLVKKDSLLGFSGTYRLLAVMFAERGDGIRLNSARPATRRERKEYEESAEHH
jgi:uncharacterized DUF497 family protein